MGLRICLPSLGGGKSSKKRRLEDGKQILTNEQKEDRLYGAKGITRSLSDVIQCELPIQSEAVLLPFGNKIIYDGFISSMPIGFAEGAKQAFREMYKTALEHGIITKSI